MKQQKFSNVALYSSLHLFNCLVRFEKESARESMCINSYITTGCRSFEHLRQLRTSN